MRLQMLLLAAGAALSAGGAQAASVELVDTFARVTVIPEARSDIKVEVVRSHGQLPIEVRTEGDRTVIDGGLSRRIRDCNRDGDKGRVRIRDLGNVRWDEAPQLVIRTPRNVVLSANGAVSGQIGRSGGLRLSNSGCSHWTVADVAGEAMIRESGAGSVRMGSADRLVIRLSGAGSVRATQVRHSLDADLSGAGGVSVEEFSGDLDASVSGVGKVKVAHGHASSLKASVSGIGGVDFDGAADSLDASISGLGGVRVKSVSGPVRKSVSGIGRVTIGGH
jgi:hypothetical protein